MPPRGQLTPTGTGRIATAVPPPISELRNQENALANANRQRGWHAKDRKSGGIDRDIIAPPSSSRPTK
jgi:hypothetical protein